MYLDRASGEVSGTVDLSNEDEPSALTCPPALLSLIVTGVAWMIMLLLCLCRCAFPQCSWYVFRFWMAVSFPGLVSDSGHDGARLCPHWRNLPLFYGVSGFQKVGYICFLKALTKWFFYVVDSRWAAYWKKREKREKQASAHKLIWKHIALVLVSTPSLTGKWPRFPRKSLLSLYTHLDYYERMQPLISSQTFTLTHTYTYRHMHTQMHTHS